MRILIFLMLSACSLSVDRSGTSFQCDPGGTCPDGYTCVEEICLPNQPPGCSEKVAAGGDHTCAIRKDGTLWCWGFNGFGQLGNDNTTDSATPVQVAMLADVTALDVGGTFTCAANLTGAFCWGENKLGQLGNGSTSDNHIPSPVKNVANVTQLAAGSTHACALSSDGMVSCWGDNSSGQLGDGTLASRNSAAIVSGLPPITAITAGGAHTCAIDNTGMAHCWGNNTSGQLGRGTQSTSEPMPMRVMNIAGVTKIAAGGAFTCAIGSEGLKCWGSSGQLGNASSMNSSVPVSTALPVPATSVAAGNEHVCATDPDHNLWCWGRNSEAELGDTLTQGRGVPVLSTLVKVDQIDLGAFHTCAVLDQDGIACVGSQTRGQLGDGKKTIAVTPQLVPDVMGAKTVAAGAGFSCASLSNGAVKCWGDNTEGSVGDGSFTTRLHAASVVGIANVKAISGGSRHVCAELTDGGMSCWGANGSGQVGDATTNTTSIPRPVYPGGPPSVVELASSSSCAVVSGQAKCWGMGAVMPGDVSNGLSSLKGFARGANHACAIKSDNSVACWGNNFYGQLGKGDTADPPSPTDVFDTGISAKKIYAESDGTCAILMNDTVDCWGRNFSNWLGVAQAGTAVVTPQPVIGLAGVTSVSMRPNDEGICALKMDGTVACWGANPFGQLGDGTVSSRGQATLVSDLSNVIDLASGANHTCAAKMDGTVACWGSDSTGQLGDGAKTSTIPGSVRMTCP